MLVYNKDRKLFLGERYGQKGVWQFPQGGVEEGISLEANVLRELDEELGCPSSLFRIEKKLIATHKYDFAKPPAYAVGRWRGQEQTFWLVEFLGKDSDITLSGHDPMEFQSWQWCTVDEVRKVAEPKRLPGYEAPLIEFQQLACLGK